MYTCTIDIDFLLQENSLALPSSLAKQWRLTKKEIIIKFGQVEALTKLIINKNSAKSQKVLISETLASTLRVPKNLKKLHLSFNQKDSTLYLGPVFMIWTDVAARDFTSAFFTFCKEVVEAGNKMGIFTFIKIKDSEFGYILHEGEWLKEAILPEPDVIYNRIHSRRYENNKAVLSIKDNDSNAYFFNESFLNKWNTHEWLLHDQDIHPYLPWTLLLTAENLFSILESYQSVYIKPINGSQGKGIYVIEAREEKGYWVTPSFRKKTEPEILRTGEQLRSFIERLISKKKYIVQHTIPLLRIDERLVDFRFLLHFYNDQWNVTSTVARIGEPAKVISNQAQGGEIQKPLEVLEHWFPTEATKKYVKMLDLSIKAARVIHEKANGLFCELGLDLAISESGDIWILEVNSKPSKTDPVREDLLIRPSARALCKTCLSLYSDGHLQERI